MRGSWPSGGGRWSILDQPADWVLTWRTDRGRRGSRNLTRRGNFPGPAPFSAVLVASFTASKGVSARVVLVADGAGLARQGGSGQEEKIVHQHETNTREPAA